MKKSIIVAFVWLSTAFLGYEDALDYLSHLPYNTRMTAHISPALQTGRYEPVFLVIFQGESA